MIRIALPALILLGLPFALSEFWTFIAIEVLAFALYAVSFNVLLGYGGMLSFGHAAFFVVGGYAAAILMKKAGLPFTLKLEPKAARDFFNDTTSTYVPDAAKDAWAMTLDWFAAHLSA